MARDEPDWDELFEIDRKVCRCAVDNLSAHIERTAIGTAKSHEFPPIRKKLSGENHKYNGKRFRPRSSFNPMEQYEVGGRVAFTRLMENFLDPRIFQEITRNVYDRQYELWALGELKSAASLIDDLLPGSKVWWHNYTGIYDDIVRMLTRQRDRLGEANATYLNNAWAPYLKLSSDEQVFTGLTCTAEALRAQRFLLEHAGREDLLPCPVGIWLTPTHGTHLPQPPQDLKAYVEKIREHLEINPGDRNLTKNTLVTLIDGRRKNVLQALQWLEEQDEYDPS